MLKDAKFPRLSPSTYRNAHIFRNKYSYIHAYIYIYVCVCVCVHKYTKNILKPIYSHIHTHIQVHTHTYVYIIWTLIYVDGWFDGFYGISIFVGYLTPNPFLCKYSVLFKTIQFSINTQFNCQKHLFQTIQ